MSKWTHERGREHYFRRAKREGYRARAAYKLKQINDRYHVIGRGDVVVDLGCAPGSWLQVASELVGPSGHVVGIDMRSVVPVPGVTVLQGDLLTLAAEDLIEHALVGRRPDVVLSDMAPNTSGNRLRDHLQSLSLAEAAVAFARKHLCPGGNLVVKVFEGGDLPEFLSRVRGVFRFCKPHAPLASRKKSTEIYIVASGFRGSRGSPQSARSPSQTTPVPD
jgi:23S rRNA (uridine2552-2'-O)-methyltransferase